jgi:hypothetical protein
MDSKMIRDSMHGLPAVESIGYLPRRPIKFQWCYIYYRHYKAKGQALFAGTLRIYADTDI